MPKMTGIQLAAELVRIRPDIPIILITGLADGTTPEDAAEMGVQACIIKPFGVRELDAAVGVTWELGRASCFFVEKERY